MNESEFDDLKLALSKIGTTVKRITVKPLKPSSDENANEDLSTGGSGEFDVNLDF